MQWKINIGTIVLLNPTGPSRKLQVPCKVTIGTITLFYWQVVLNPAGPSSKLQVPCKITIGTIPLKTLFAEYNEAARRAGHTSQPLPQVPSAPHEGMFSNYPPPDARKFYFFCWTEVLSVGPVMPSLSDFG